MFELNICAPENSIQLRWKQVETERNREKQTEVNACNEDKLIAYHRSWWLLPGSFNKINGQ